MTDSRRKGASVSHTGKNGLSGQIVLFPDTSDFCYRSGTHPLRLPARGPFSTNDAHSATGQRSITIRLKSDNEANCLISGGAHQFVIPGSIAVKLHVPTFSGIPH